MANERHEVAFLVGAVLGGVAAAAYGLLNAPQAGADTRAELATRWDDLVARLAQGLAGLDADPREPVAGETAATPPAADVTGGPRIEASRGEPASRPGLPQSATHTDQGDRSRRPHDSDGEGKHA